MEESSTSTWKPNRTSRTPSRHCLYSARMRRKNQPPWEETALTCSGTRQEHTFAHFSAELRIATRSTISDICSYCSFANFILFIQVIQVMKEIWTRQTQVLHGYRMYKYLTPFYFFKTLFSWSIIYQTGIADVLTT